MYLINRFWDGIACFPKFTIGEKCSINDNCQSQVGLICTSGICRYV
jgi:hypothetical protein